MKIIKDVLVWCFNCDKFINRIQRRYGGTVIFDNTQGYWTNRETHHTPGYLQCARCKGNVKVIDITSADTINEYSTRTTIEIIEKHLDELEEISPSTALDEKIKSIRNCLRHIDRNNKTIQQILSDPEKNIETSVRELLRRILEGGIK